MKIRSRLIHLILFTFLLLGTRVGNAQSDERPTERKIDSAMAISPEYMPVTVARLQGFQFNPLVYKSIDTTFFYTSEYDPLNRTEGIYQTLGIYSQAHRSMVFDFEREPGFSMITLPYPIYFKTENDLCYYDVKGSFTDISAAFGLTTEQRIHAIHAQKIRRFEFNAQLEGYNNSGYFLRQGCNLFDLNAVIHYSTPKNIYGFIGSYIINHAKFQENGGLEDYDLFIGRHFSDEDLTTDLMTFSVLFGNALSTINTHNAQWQQYVNIKDKNNRYFGTLTHTFQFKTLKSVFEDTHLNNDYYQNIYYINTDSTRDTVNYYSIVNSLQWSNYEPLSRQSDQNYFFRIAGGIRHEYVHAKMPFYIGNNYTLFARTNIRLFSVWDLFGSIAYSFNNYNRGDAIAHLGATFSISRKLQHYIGLNADFYRTSPDFFYTYYIGNNNLWYLAWPKENTMKLGAYWTLFGYKLGFNYFMLNHHLYLNEHRTPTMAEKGIHVVQFNLFAPFRVKNFSVDANLALQHSTSPVVALPLFAGKLRAAWHFRIFKNRLRVQLGTDLMYNTLYYADAYTPVLHQYYHQENVKVGNYLFWDLDLTLQVSRLSFFVRGNNLLEGLIGYKYFTTPFYPMQSRRVSIGINWKFYD